ncbi:hypothetical protein [Agrococcus sp. ARC_14]|uniref:hypothetical protein n=1 Tax=Agrococcus sp. ARC_14 TaxID=2919927 RepID=UPI001F05B8B3|nr:hypothetical protein [Agrococcus sp. ARC_14]MCH1883441.1 hypothetical protein [Agrococcus sp. ARC_14]
MTMRDRSPLPPQSAGQSHSPRERHGRHDPAKHEWTAGDIKFGWLVGASVVLAGSLVIGVIMWGSAALMGVFGGVLLGLPMLTLYGVPVAIAAASALRRVNSEAIHLLVFAALGAIGGGITALLAQGIVAGWALAPSTVILGATTAVIARAVAHDTASRTRGSGNL